MERIREIIAPVLDDMGYDLVRVQLQGRKQATLQVMAERKDERPMTVEDCAAISRSLSAVLDVEDPVAGPYTLEVSSPGIDRPLTRRRDFERFAGFTAKVEMDHVIGGRKRFTGMLRGLEGDDIVVEIDGERVMLPLDAVHKAKLVMTDALLEAAAQQQGTTD